MNLPNKITIVRILLSAIILIILLVPWYSLGFSWPEYLVGNVTVNIKYVVVGVLFLVASLSDFLDGYIARKYHLVTDFGKMLDAIADKILVNSVLIILASTGFVHPIIAVIVVMRDTVVNTIKMIAGNKGKVVAAIKTGKIKTACLMIGIVLTLFYNLPFELWNLRVADLLLVIAAVLSIVSGIRYYSLNKEYVFKKGEI